MRYFKSYLFSIYYKNGLIDFIEKISFVDLFIKSSFGRISRCHDLWNLLFNYFALVLLGLGITMTCFFYLFLLAIFKAFDCLFNRHFLDINSVDALTEHIDCSTYKPTHHTTHTYSIIFHMFLCTHHYFLS